MSTWKTYLSVIITSTIIFAVTLPIYHILLYYLLPGRTRSFRESSGELIVMAMIPIFIIFWIVKLLRKARLGKYFYADKKTMVPLMGTSLMLGTVSFGTFTIYMMLGDRMPFNIVRVGIVLALYFYILGFTAYATTPETTSLKNTLTQR